MTVLSRKTVLFILAAILLLSLATRYPLVEHERFQSDSYFIHILADSIVDEGHAKWTFNPLSYVGYYPISYPSGVPFLLAELSELTGLRVEVCVLLTDIMLAVMFCLGAFLLARQFIMRPEFVLLATLFAVLGPRFIDTTDWDASARGPLIVFMTLAVLAAFRGSAMGQRWMLAVSVILGAATFALHHMAVLFVLVGISHVIATFESRYLFPRITIRRRLVAVVINSSFLLGVFAIAFIAFDYLTSPEQSGLNESYLFDFDPPVVSTLANLAASYTNQIGFILPVAVVAIISMFRHSQFSVTNIFLFSMLVAFIPLLDRALYVAMVLTPFVAIMGTLWLRNLSMKTKRKSLVLLLVLVLIASSIFLPVWSSARWNDDRYMTGDSVEVDDQDYDDATYLRVTYPDVFAVSNNNLGSMVLYANSDTKLLSSGIFLAVNGDTVEGDIGRLTFWGTSFPNNLYKWFDYPDEPDVDLHVYRIFVTGMDYLYSNTSVPVGRFANHTELLVLVDRDLENKYANEYVVGNAAFPGQLLNAEWIKKTSIPPTYQSTNPLESYMVYQSGGIIAYAFAYSK